MIYLVFEDFDDGWSGDESCSYEDKLLAAFNSREQAIKYMIEQGELLLSDGYKNKPIRISTTGIKNLIAAASYEHDGNSYFHFTVESDFGEINLY